MFLLIKYANFVASNESVNVKIKEIAMPRMPRTPRMVPRTPRCLACFIKHRRRCSRVVDLKLPIFLEAVMSEDPFEIEVSDEKKNI